MDKVWSSLRDNVSQIAEKMSATAETVKEKVQQAKMSELLDNIATNITNLAIGEEDDNEEDDETTDEDLERKSKMRCKLFDSFKEVRELKNLRKEEIANIVERTSENLIETSEEDASPKSLESKDDFLALTKKLSKVKNELDIIRMKGDIFVVGIKNSHYLLIISSKGKCYLIPKNMDVKLKIFDHYCNLHQMHGTEPEATFEEVYFLSIDTKLKYHFYTGEMKCIGDYDYSKLKKQFESYDSTFEKGLQNYLIIEFATHKKKLLFCIRESEECKDVVNYHLQKTLNSKQLLLSELSHLQSFKNVKYVHDNIQHYEILEEIWYMVFPDEELEGKRTRQWVTLGFQGDNPETDFRALGTLGLRMMYYFFSHYTDYAREIICKDREYPLSLSCINVTHAFLSLFLADDSENIPLSETFSRKDCNSLTFSMICSFVTDHLEISGTQQNVDIPSNQVTSQEIGKSVTTTTTTTTTSKSLISNNQKFRNETIKDNPIANFDPKMSPFYELFCLYCLLLDKIWILENANYMDYSKILAITRKQLFGAIKEYKPVTLRQLKQVLEV